MRAEGSDPQGLGSPKNCSSFSKAQFMVTLGVKEGTKGREGKKEGTGRGGEGKEEKGQENVQ